jgi:hypothetical protein
MNQYDYHEEDDEDNYNDDYDYDHSYDYNSKFYFKFDDKAWSEWLEKAMKDLIENKSGLWSFIIDPSLFPVKNIGFSDIGEKTSHQYLGTNIHNEQIWKIKHFIEQKEKITYIKHLQSHAVYFLKEPLYYKGLFNIMN